MPYQNLPAYRQNANFTGPVIGIPEPIIPNWPKNGFRSLTEEHQLLLPKLSEGQIQAYLMYRTAVDKASISDVKSIEKGKSLYESGRVEACSIHITQTDVNFSGIVRAAMKKMRGNDYQFI
ncbi:hypothetical protein KUTeg_015498 [Tegillarca granosa]|uniref:Uncharacterized protein n=1 Tax=Tegillarca granosa TaxID=220873 RepID=A0ABQ9EQB9_TEGGR|nr:hypothetical protein KUTeg_015498 [Tegillarca granosa]